MSLTNLLGYGINHERILNGFFDDWTGNLPDDWTVVYGTTAREDTIVNVGSYSCELAPAVGNDGFVYQDIASYYEWVGEYATFICQVYSTEAGQARIGISDGVTTTWSPYHTGSGTWEELEVTMYIGAGATTTRAILSVESTIIGTAFFDRASLPLYVEGSADATADIIIDAEIDAAESTFRTVAREVRDIIIDATFGLETGTISVVDLMPLIPTKYHDSVVLKQYIDEVSILVGTWIASIQDMEGLLNPDTVPDEYIQFLAGLIGLTIAVDEDTTTEDKRDQLRQAIDWYKIKGTYESILLVAYMSGLTTAVYDFYTNDYVIFEKVVDFFAGNEGENPPGFDSSYYKSPHFGIEVLLDRVYNLGGSDEFLFRETKITKMIDLIEDTRPVNTVPHYITMLIPLGYEDGIVYQASGNLAYTTVTDAWTFNKMYFDGGTNQLVKDNLGQQVYDNMGNRVVVQGESWKFDDGVFFDQNYEAFLNSIIKWQLGIGNKGIIPSRTGFVLEDVKLQGDMHEIRIYPDRTEFELVVDASLVQPGLSELGLFLPDNSTMTIASTFRDLDKINGVELRIQVIVYKIRP